MSLDERIEDLRARIDSSEWSMAGGEFWTENHGPNRQYRNYVIPIYRPVEEEHEIILPGDTEQEIYLPGPEEEDWYIEVDEDV